MNIWMKNAWQIWLQSINESLSESRMYIWNSINPPPPLSFAGHLRVSQRFFCRGASGTQTEHTWHCQRPGGKFRRNRSEAWAPQVWGGPQSRQHSTAYPPLTNDLLLPCQREKRARENSSRASAFGPPVLPSLPIHKTARSFAHLLALVGEKPSLCACSSDAVPLANFCFVFVSFFFIRGWTFIFGQYWFIFCSLHICIPFSKRKPTRKIKFEKRIWFVEGGDRLGSISSRRVRRESRSILFALFSTYSAGIY